MRMEFGLGGWIDKKATVAQGKGGGGCCLEVKAVLLWSVNQRVMWSCRISLAKMEKEMSLWESEIGREILLQPSIAWQVVKELYG